MRQLMDPIADCIDVGQDGPCPVAQPVEPMWRHDLTAKSRRGRVPSDVNQRPSEMAVGRTLLKKKRVARSRRARRLVKRIESCAVRCRFVSRD